MIKTIQVEPIKNREHFLNMPFLTKEEVKTAMDRVVKQTELNMEYFGTRFPWPAAKQVHMRSLTTSNGQTASGPVFYGSATSTPRMRSSGNVLRKIWLLS